MKHHFNRKIPSIDERPCRGRWRMFLLFAASFAALAGIAGCLGHTQEPSVSNTMTPDISVSISTAVPTYLVAGSSIPLSAVVGNDPASAGVDWVVVCDSTPLCGSFSPVHTASGGTTVYTAPAEVPAHGMVTILGLSKTNRGKQAAAYVTILSHITGITITQPPPVSAPAGVTISFGATVFGDTSNLGVDWKAACGTTGAQRTPLDCTPIGFHSQSGGSATFVVPLPQQIPNIVGSTVTITAYATADHSYSATTLFTVTVVPTITLTQVPPSTMITNATAPLVAVVANDTTNSGVTWSVGCAVGPCGSLSKTHTTSGEATIFTAPSVPPPANNPPVLITAYSASSGTLVFASASVTIVAPLSIKITRGVPIGTIVQGTSAFLVAAVNNDPANAGVDWTVSCGSPGACGSFSSAHTPSGAATTYTAPSSVPAGNAVTISATSTTDPSQTDTQTVTVTTNLPPNSLLLGQFVIFLSARNSANGPYVLGGVITGDGVGNITKGNVDVADASGNAVSAQLAPILSTSNYSIGPDRRGQMQLQISTGSLSGFGMNGSGTINLSFVFVSSKHALVAETDSFGDGTGTLDLQNATDLASFGFGSWHGIYSLELSGFEASPPYSGYSMASAVRIDFSGSYSYITDQSDKGVITSAPVTTVSHNLSAAPSQNGELTFASVDLGLPAARLVNFDAWLIDATHFIVTDWRDSFSGSPPIIVGGYLTAQPTNPSLFGSYAFTEAGATAAAQPQTAGGILTCGSTGTLDVTPLGGIALTGQPISATCSGPVNGRGLIAISGVATAGISQFAVYPTVDQGLYLVELDGGLTGTSGPSGAGVVFQQTISTPISSSAFVGNYALRLHASTALGSQSLDGQIISDGVSNFSGIANANSFNTTPRSGTPSLNATLTGSFTVGTTGRFPLALTIVPATGQPTPQITTLQSACYIVDANTCLLLELDTTAPGTGILQLQY